MGGFATIVPSIAGPGTAVVAGAVKSGHSTDVPVCARLQAAAAGVTIEATAIAEIHKTDVR